MDYSVQLQQIIDQQQLIIDHLINIEAGLQFLMYVGLAFFVWKVISILYKLFGGVFFGGV